MMVYLQLFWIFCKIGAVTFGGGYAMLPLFQQELERLGWLSAEQFTDIVSVAQMTPGAVSLNTATYVGSLQAGPLGALAATLGLVLPGFLLSILIIHIATQVATNRHLERAIRGIRAAAIGLIGGAVLFFFERSMIIGEIPRFGNPLSGWTEVTPIWVAIAIGVVVFFLNYKKVLSPFLAIPLAFGLGVLVL